MSKFEINYFESGEYRIYIDRDIDPEEFLDCEDEDELRDEILEYMAYESWDDLEYPEIYERNTDIPEEFFEEWRRLKNEAKVDKEQKENN